MQDANEDPPGATHRLAVLLHKQHWLPRPNLVVVELQSRHTRPSSSLIFLLTLPAILYPLRLESSRCPSSHHGPFYGQLGRRRFRRRGWSPNRSFDNHRVVVTVVV